MVTAAILKIDVFEYNEDQYTYKEAHVIIEELSR